MKLLLKCTSMMRESMSAACHFVSSSSPRTSSNRRTLADELAQHTEDLEDLLALLARRVVHRHREQAKRLVDIGRLWRGVAHAPEAEVLARKLLRDERVELERRAEAAADFGEELDFERGAAGAVELEDLGWRGGSACERGWRALGRKRTLYADSSMRSREMRTFCRWSRPRKPRLSSRLDESAFA